MSASLIVSMAVAATMLPLGAAAQSGAVPAATPRQEVAESLQITDPYIELHTGPGRGFPVFFVAPRGQKISLELRHTDWYKVRTQTEQVGWVHRRQLQSTLTAAGATKSFRDIVVDDYLNRRVQLGASWGRFNAEPMLKMWTSYRLSDTLSVEATLGQAQGKFSGADYYHINVVSEPWSDRRLSPFFSLGMGKFKNEPNRSLAGATAGVSQLGNASIGARYYLSERFIVRADYTIYTSFASDTRTLDYRAVTAGLGFFF